MSMCEGNPLSAHLLGDALALAAAAAQAPCLCNEMCTVLGRSGCAISVVLLVISLSSSFCHRRMQPAIQAFAVLASAHQETPPCLYRGMSKQAAQIIFDLPLATCKWAVLSSAARQFASTLTDI